MGTRIYKVEKGDKVETVVGDGELVSRLGDIVLPCKNIQELIKTGGTYLDKEGIKIMVVCRYSEEATNA